MSSYRTFKIDGKTAHVKKDLDRLTQIGGVVFDCDGVLIDASKSYDQAIVETVAFFGERIIANPFPKSITSPEFLARLRESGGFNNDWDTCYATLLTLFSQTPTQVQNRLTGAIAVEKNPSKILKRIMAPPPSDASFTSHAKTALQEMAEKVDSTGIKSVESFVLSSPLSKGTFNAFKELLGYPGRVGTSILATIFNEYFYGAELFRQAHGSDAEFHGGRGLIGNECLLVSSETMLQLKDIFEGGGLGIASGRSRLATRFTLGRLWDYFKPEATIFIEDEEALNPNVKVGKPEPYSLLKAAKAMQNPKTVLYVGDSTEDLLMTERANAELRKRRFLFAGVYQHAHDPDRKRKMFLEKKADIIIPSVDLLPKTLELARRS
ncbi:MAG: hypothetical protein HY619_03755 [Thaumarchaeota archaeon]|nr:hypothetical protein [Nitrososphaerota archaeon]